MSPHRTMRDRSAMAPGAGRALALLAGLLGPLLLAQGCGSKFDLPTETRAGRVIPGERTYKVEATWSGMDNIRDVLLTPAGQLFLLFNDPNRPVPRGSVGAYARLAPTGPQAPLGGYPFHTLLSPVAMCEDGNSVYVLDQGDTCLARKNPSGADCSSAGGWTGEITDLASYWRVREFNAVGGGGGGLDTIGTFTDTTLASVEGVAVDQQGNLYVSGTAIINVPDPFDERFHTRTFFHRIYRYRRGPRYPGVVPGDPNMPGALWHRDTTWVVEEGEGSGYIQDARGLLWRATDASHGLYAADAASGRIELLSDALKNSALLQINDDGHGNSMIGTLDVFADQLGNIYGTDTGHAHVLRFDAQGAFVQQVDSDPAGPVLQRPVAVAADSEMVFVGDAGLGKVIRYRRTN